MRIPGPSEASIRLVDLPKGAGRGGSLVAGALVSALVRERIDPELYRIAIGPKLYTAASAQALEPGTMLKARVERSGDAILLRINLPAGREAALTAALTAAALPNDAAARVAVAALLREGMAPEPRALIRVRRAALREAAEGGEWTDLAAKLEAKGIPAEGATLEGLASASDGRRWSGGGGGGGYGSGSDGGHADGGGVDTSQLEPETELAVPEGDLPRVLGGLLRMLAGRTDDGGGGPADLALPLFNHQRGPEGSWVIVPFHFALDAVDFAGSFRIQLPYVRGGPGLFEARFSASRAASSEDWSLFLNFGGGRATAIRIEGPAVGDGFEEFSAALSAASPALSSPLRVLMRREEAKGADTAPMEAGLDLDA